MKLKEHIASSDTDTFLPKFPYFVHATLQKGRREEAVFKPSNDSPSFFLW
jgi:hypothetical protein